MAKLSAFTVADASSAIEPVCAALVEVAKTTGRDALAKYKNSKARTALARKLSQFTYVKRLWDFDTSSSLYSFYYPSRIEIDGGQSKEVKSIKDIGTNQHFVIQGTVGQGKSIFLRYLCGQELRNSTSSSRIPVLIELRKIQSRTTLEALLEQGLRDLGFDVSGDLVRRYASSGQLLLLLDAFDEVPDSLVVRTIQEIESFASMYAQLQIVVSARPDSEIQNSNFFRVIKLCPLNPGDHLPFLMQVCQDTSQAKALSKAIRGSSTQIRELLTTPLLMTLLVVLYQSQQVVPDTVPSFYEQLFDVLFYRHDKSKPGFRRTRYTKLDDTQIKTLFEAFCFSARQSDETTSLMSSDSFNSTTINAIKLTGIEVGGQAFKNEIVKTACLMQEEGFGLSFIHKSVAEFHAAGFIKHSSESVGDAFYTANLGESKWAYWRQELAFLSKIDEYRYSRFFVVPSIDHLMRVLEISDKESGETALLNAERLAGQDIYVLARRHDDDWKPKAALGAFSSTSYGMHLLLSEWTFRLTQYFEDDMPIAQAVSKALTANRIEPFHVEPTRRIGTGRIRYHQLAHDATIAPILSSTFKESIDAVRIRRDQAQACIAREDEKLSIIRMLARR